MDNHKINKEDRRTKVENVAELTFFADCKTATNQEQLKVGTARLMEEKYRDVSKFFFFK